MTATAVNQNTPPELHIKICKKIAQLTKVIYVLNTKAEEHDSIVEHLNDEHKKEIQSIMSQCKIKVDRFKNECKYAAEKEVELKNIHEVLKQVKEENEHLQKSLEEYIANNELNENQLRTGYENKYLELQNKFLEHKRNYSELLESFDTYPKEILGTKQKEIDRLVSEHKEEIKNMNHMFEKDLDTVKAEKLKSESILNKKLLSLESINHQMNADNEQRESEYESKINKLKQFYEEELKTCQLANDKSEEWQKEKANIVSAFQLKKAELDTCLRYLEKTNNTKETEIKELSGKLNLLQSDYNNSTKMMTNLQRTIETKDDELVMSRNENESLRNKTMLLEEKLNAACLSNDNYKQIEEAYGMISGNLEDYKKKFTSLTLEYSQLEDMHIQLKSKFDLVQKDNVKLNDLFDTITNEKSSEINRSKYLEEELEGKRQLITSLEERISLLEGECSDTSAECIDYKDKLEDLKEMFFQSNTKLKESHTKELIRIKETHAEKLRNIQNESEILLEKQLEMFKIEKEENEGKYSNLIQLKDELIQKLTLSLEESQGNLELTKRDLERNAEKNRLLKTGLQDKGQMIEDTIEQYDQKISKMKCDFQNEMDKEKKEKQEMERSKDEILADYNSKLEKLEKKWQEKLRTATEEGEQLLKQCEKKYDQQLSIISSKHESELFNLKLGKDDEIELLKKEINSFKSHIEKLQSDSYRVEKTHNTLLKDKLSIFEGEKEELRMIHKREINELRERQEKEMEERIKCLQIEKQNALDILKRQHESSIQEIRNEHLQSIKALRSQLNIEKEESVGMIRSQFANDKQRLHEVLTVQTDEKIKCLIRDYEGQLQTFKEKLEQSFQQRQQELLVHSRKINELTNNLEDEKAEVISLKNKLIEAEEKERFLSNELTTKGEEILEIRRESNFKMRTELENLGNAYKKDKEDMINEFRHEQMKDYKKWESSKEELIDQISSLKMLLEELEEKFANRPSRAEDIEKLNDLSKKLFERELECRKLGEERKHYKLELVNREENFNKVFNSSPNVGIMNPIELSKRKSSKKR